MAIEVEIVKGPLASVVSHDDAKAKLESHPAFPKNASFVMEEVEGHWVAAVASETVTKESAPPFDGPPAPDAPAPDGPPTDGPPTDDAPSDDAPSDDDAPKDEGDDKPKGEKGEKKGLEAQVEHLTDLLTKVVDALGLGDPAGDSPVPGLDEPHGGPEGPEGLDGPPAPGPDAPGGDNKTHTVHERALKPGEAPPGTTPVGAPAFASTMPDNHPWKAIAGVKRTFVVEEPLEDGETLSSVSSELHALAKGTGYKLEQLVEGNADGRRTAKAIIAADTQK